MALGKQRNSATAGLMMTMGRRRSSSRALDILQGQSSRDKILSALGLRRSETGQITTATDGGDDPNTSQHSEYSSVGNDDSLSRSHSSPELLCIHEEKKPPKKFLPKKNNTFSNKSSTTGGGGGGPAFGRSQTHQDIGGARKRRASFRRSPPPPSSGARGGGGGNGGPAFGRSQTVDQIAPRRKDVVLPERTLISGKGPERLNNMFRRHSERNLVKKISQSIQNIELSSHGSVTSQQNAFDDSNSTTRSFRGGGLHRQGSASSLSLAFEDSCASMDFASQMEDDDEWKNETKVDTVAIAPTKNRFVPPIHRKELVTDYLLGEGAFSKVIAVKGIQLMGQEEFNSQVKKHQAKTQYQQDESQSPEEEMAHALAMMEGREELAKGHPVPSEEVSVDSSSSSLLAVKHLNRRLLRKPKVFQQAALDLAREAQILAAVDCDYIIKLRAMSLGGTSSLDSGRFNDFFLVLDRLEDTLDSRIVQWRDDPQTSPSANSFLIRVTTYALELASALDYLHERHVVFRDTKPQNVGFKVLQQQQPPEEAPTSTEGGDKMRKDRVQLFDFGLCRSLPDDSEAEGAAEREEDDDGSVHLDQMQDEPVFHMSIAGTTRYMSPEMQLQDAYNRKTDVYSWAMTYYEMLCLRKPYEDILRAHQFVELVGNMGKRPDLDGHPHLPECIQNTLRGAWCTSIPDRLSMGQVKTQLEEVLVKLKQQQ